MATIGTTSRPAYVYDQETDTWVPVGVGPHTHENFITSTTIDAKGDLLAGSAPDTVGRLPIGANGTLLVADSTETLGMAWTNTITIASGSTVPLTIQNNGTGNSFVVNDVASDTTAFIIDASGNVGIGITPGFKLDVGGTQRIIGGGEWGLRLVSSNATSSNRNHILFQRDNAGSAVTSGFTLGGLSLAGYDGTNYGFGFNGGVEITAFASQTWTSANRGSELGFFTTQNNTNFVNERMRIDNAGNVGIGTLTPTAKLDVNGSINSSNLSSVNAVLNSSFNVWQRGTSGFAPATGNNGTGYAADRWFLIRGGYAQGATLSRQVTGDTTNLPNIQYCARLQRNSGNTALNALGISQSFETINSIPFAGKTVTLSFYARAGANYSGSATGFAGQLYSGTGTDQIVSIGYSGFNVVASATPSLGGLPSLTTTWQRFTATGTVPSTATEIALSCDYTPAGTAGANDWVEVTGVQVELGNVATPYRSNQPTYQAELAACQRYYEKSYAVGTTPGTVTDSGSVIWCSNGNTGDIATQPIFFKVAKRATPTITVYSPVSGTAGNIRNIATNTDEAAQTYYNSENGFSYRTTAAATANARYNGHYVASIEL